MAVIEVRDLHKRYGDNHAVDGVSFSIEEGEVFALLGPNGAGKSTTVEILEGLRRRTSGEVSVLGHDPGRASRELRDRIGIVLQTSGIERELTVREALEIYGAAYRRRRPVSEVIELVGLEEKVDARIGTLSGGQQRRIDLALGLVGDPDVLFLDEPTTGFDPSARRRSWDVVSSLGALGKTVLLTTHYMDEAQHLADRVAVIAGGRIVADGTPEQLGESAGTSRVSFVAPEGVGIEDLPSSVAAHARLVGDGMVVETASPTRLLRDLTTWAVDRSIELDDLVVTRPSLEDVYLGLTEGGEQ